MKKKKIKKIFIILSLSIVGAVVISFLALLIFSSTIKIDEEKLKVADFDIKIYDENENLISLSKSYTKLEDMPDHLKQAFIATEDKRFYSHNGLDYVRIAGAVVHDLKSHSLEQGASTISCQLIKNTHLSNEKTFNRKLKEAILATKLEKVYSKDDILEMYLNVIYFGAGIYGVSNASFMFFGKQPKDLTLSECASLASVVVNPKNYSPILNIQNNNKRKNTVLSLMKDQGYISQEEYEKEKDVEIVTNTPSSVKFSDYTSLVLREASDILGCPELDIKRNGYQIYTYMNAEQQQKSQNSLQDEETSASLMIADPNNFSITAYASNHPYSPFTMKRNAGSIIKPFVYASAYENKLIFPATLIEDTPTDFGNYRPRNFGDNYRGKISIREAISHSSNVCAVKVLQTVGFPRALNTFNSFGFKTSQKDENYSLALGVLSEGVTIKQVTQAYSVFANGGSFQNISTIKMIKDSNGRIVYLRQSNPEKIISSDAVSMVNDCLMNCAQVGTAKKLSRFTGLCAKTGTFEVGEKNSDAWCVAYSNDYVYCSWLGNLSMKKEDMIENKGSYGINHLEKIIQRNFTPAPIKMAKKRLDLLVLNRTGQIKLASSNTPERFVVYDFAPENAEVSTLFTSPSVDAKTTLSGHLIEIKIKTVKECVYEVFNQTATGLEEVALVQGNDDEQTVSCFPIYGINEIIIVPIVKGKIAIEGTPFLETIYY